MKQAPFDFCKIFNFHIYNLVSKLGVDKIKKKIILGLTKFSTLQFFGVLDNRPRKLHFNFVLQLSNLRTDSRAAKSMCRSSCSVLNVTLLVFKTMTLVEGQLSIQIKLDMIIMQRLINLFTSLATLYLLWHLAITYAYGQNQTDARIDLGIENFQRKSNKSNFQVAPYPALPFRPPLMSGLESPYACTHFL